MKSDLTFFLAISGETPCEYLTTWDGDTRDIEHALARVLPADRLNEIDCGKIARESSEYFSDLDEFKSDQVHYIRFYGELSRDAVETLARDGYLSGDTCDTLGILTPYGFLPALSFDVEMSFSFVSLYICPIYRDEVPTFASFNRALRALANL